MIESSTQIRVRYVETDQMGIVYHSNYFHWFEIARIHMLDELKIPYIELEKKGYRLPVLDCYAKFIQPALFDDKITIKAKIEDKPLLRIVVTYEVLRGETLLATGKTSHAFVDDKGHAQKPPKEFAEVTKSYFWAKVLSI